MDNLTAMEYLADIMNVYLPYIPVSVRIQFEIKEALSLGIGALKTIEDMGKFNAPCFDNPPHYEIIDANTKGETVND